MLKFAPKEKAPNRVAQLDDAGQAIVAQIRTAADLAKEDCDRAMSLHTSFPWNSERPKTEHSKWRARLSTGEIEQPAPNNGFGRSSKRLKKNCSPGDHPPARKGSLSVSPTVALLEGAESPRQQYATYSRLDANKETVVYCQSGVRAAETAAVLDKLGFRNVKVYDFILARLRRQARCPGGE